MGAQSEQGRRIFHPKYRQLIPIAIQEVLATAPERQLSRRLTHIGELSDLEELQGTFALLKSCGYRVESVRLVISVWR